jgi:quercetin dioxygenase-like cupin family protein
MVISGFAIAGVPMKAYIVALSALVVTACSAPPQAQDVETAEPHSAEASEPHSVYRPQPGSNEMVRAPLTLAEGLEVIISDVVIPPNATVPRHYHPGEEFVYVIEGTAVHVEEGQPEQLLQAGDTYVIPPGVEHAPRAGETGARAIVVRVHVEGEPERILVDE